MRLLETAGQLGVEKSKAFGQIMELEVEPVEACGTPGGGKKQRLHAKVMKSMSGWLGAAGHPVGEKSKTFM